MQQFEGCALSEEAHTLLNCFAMFPANGTASLTSIMLNGGEIRSDYAPYAPANRSEACFYSPWSRLLARQLAPHYIEPPPRFLCQDQKQIRRYCVHVKAYLWTLESLGKYAASDRPAISKVKF